MPTVLRLSKHIAKRIQSAIRTYYDHTVEDWIEVGEWIQRDNFNRFMLMVKLVRQGVVHELDRITDGSEMDMAYEDLNDLDVFLDHFQDACADDILAFIQNGDM